MFLKDVCLILYALSQQMASFIDLFALEVIYKFDIGMIDL